MRPNIFLATIGRGSNGSNALEVTEDRAAVTAESQDNIINRVNNVSQYGPSWHYVPGIGVAGTAYAEVPGSALGDLAFSRASSKTRTNAAGVIETIGNNVPPHDYRNADGSLSTFPRLNLEPQRTNSIRNSSMVGAVAGSPGTLPTNWTISTAVTQTIVGSGTENGMAYIDIRFNGTASGSLILLSSESSSGIAASNGQTWTNSFYFKTIASPLPPTSYNVHTIQRASGTNIGAFNLAFTPTTTLARYAQTVTTNQATITHIQPYFFASVTSGAAYDFTIRIAAPQMELGAYATTWVPTTTAAVTRLADSASKTGVSSLIGQTEGTLFVDCIPPNGVASRIFAISEPSLNNRIAINNNTTNRVDVIVRTNNTTTNGSISASASTQLNPGVINKIAFAYKSDEFSLYINGSLAGTATGVFSVTAALQQIGASEIAFLGTQFMQWNQAALFPARLTNATLAQLTTL